MRMLENRKYVGDIGKDVGKDIVVAGWVHDTRVLGGINFVVLRDFTGKGQITAEKGKVPSEVIDVIEDMHQEDVIKIHGKVVESEHTESGFEIIPDSIEILNKAGTPLPLDPREVTKALLDTQLDWRVLHMRTDEARAIFKIQTHIAKSFREFFVDRGYIEMQAPVIIGSASEGGTELFKLPYFDKEAYLAQSPQLYKQMGAVSLEKVFMILPVFRAEKHDTSAHLNEIRQMDIEQGFSTDEDVIKVLEEVFVYILGKVKEECKDELKLLGRDDLEIPELPLRKVTYTECIDLLKGAGEDIEWGHDFTKPQEKKLTELVGEIAFVLKDWPSEIKPFYAMPDKDNPKVCKAFDLMYNGMEICSGTQRVHVPELLIERINDKGLNPNDFKFYIDFFRFGAPPHSGWSIGLERLTLQITDKKNIREVTMFPRDRNRIFP